MKDFLFQLLVYLYSSPLLVGIFRLLLSNAQFVEWFRNAIGI